MKNRILIVLMLMTAIMQAQVAVDWYNYPNGVSIALDANNNSYTAYWDYNPAGDITLTKRDASGNILWNVPYNNTDNTRHEVATWVETDNSGNIIVSGTIRSGYSNPVNAASLLMKFNSSGTLLWRVVYESSFDGSSTRKCLIDASDNIYVLGIGTGPSGQVTKVKKFNSSGVSVWNYFDSGVGAPVTFKFTPDNKILIVHRSVTGSINGYSKIDLNGNNIWKLSGITSASIGDAAGDAFGNTYIVNGPQSELKKLSPSGTVLWTQLNGSLNGNKIEVGTDNNPVVAGYPIGTYGVVILKYDAAGNLLWQNLDADGPALSLLALAPMRLDASNAAYVAGSTMSAMGVCKVNSNGTSAWAATTPSGYPVWFEFGTDNNVYVTGGTTARFNQSGTVTKPAAPTNLTATPSGTSTVNLSWTDNSANETGFVLQRSLSSTSGFTTIASLGANSTAYSNTGLSAATKYFYRVQSTNSAGSSAFSNTASATTASNTIPAAPSNLVATAIGCNSISLKWTDNSNNETSFDIKRSTTLNGTYSTIATVASNITTYTNTGLTNGQRYYYRVRASNTAGNSAYSNKANAKAACLATSTHFEPVAKLSDNDALREGLVQDIKIFPNPFHEQTTIEISLAEAANVSILVRDASGRIVKQFPMQNFQKGKNRTVLELATLNRGIYFCEIFSGQDHQSIKFIKQ